jgi:hypothetical protein
MKRLQYFCHKCFLNKSWAGCLCNVYSTQRKEKGNLWNADFQVFTRNHLEPAARQAGFAKEASGSGGLG